MSSAIKFVALILIASISINIIPAHSARELDPATTQLGLLFEENTELTSMTSVIYGRSDISSVLNYKICKDVSDEVCTAASEITIFQYFVLCQNENDFNCIEEIWARKGASEKVSGIYQRHFPTKGAADFPGEPAMRLPPSKGNAFVIKIPGVIHQGGSDEYLVALRNQTFVVKRSGESAVNYQIDVQNLVGAITPFSVVEGGYRAVVQGEGFSAGGGLAITPSGDKCFSTDTGLCAAVRDFPNDYRFGMTLRLTKKLNGWFHGRISSPSISTTATSSGAIVSIEALPVRVASLDFLVPTSEVTSEAKEMLFNGREGWGSTGNPDVGVKIVTSLDEEQAATLLRLFTPNFNDRATRTSEYWTFKTLLDFKQDGVRRCTDSSGDLAGVVTTNALLYSAGPPTFNQSEGSLDYRVSAPHYESNGREAVGTYDLLLRSDVARCIYGFTEAPIKATLEVIASDGSSRVATTIINERNGWLTMSAGGFGFSSPIVRARLTQDKPEPVVTPSPSPTASPTASPTPQATTTVIKAAKKAITCIKGEKKKQVQGAKPKCPKGWKKAQRPA
jgi:hypothetical protein